MATRIFVTNLPLSITSTALSKHFSKIGTVTSISIKNAKNNKQKKIAFLGFPDSSIVEKALSLDQSYIRSSKIRVQIAIPKTNLPLKETNQLNSQKDVENDDSLKNKKSNYLELPLQKRLLTVESLPETFSDEELYFYFSFFGPIERIEFSNSSNLSKKNCKRTAVILFEDNKTARMVTENQLPPFKGRYLKVTRGFDFLKFTTNLQNQTSTFRNGKRQAAPEFTNLMFEKEKYEELMEADSFGNLKDLRKVFINMKKPTWASIYFSSSYLYSEVREKPQDSKKGGNQNDAVEMAVVESELAKVAKEEILEFSFRSKILAQDADSSGQDGKEKEKEREKEEQQSLWCINRMAFLKERTPQNVDPCVLLLKNISTFLSLEQLKKLLLEESLEAGRDVEILEPCRKSKALRILLFREANKAAIIFRKLEGADFSPKGLFITRRGCEGKGDIQSPYENKDTWHLVLSIILTKSLSSVQKNRSFLRVIRDIFLSERTAQAFIERNIFGFFWPRAEIVDFKVTSSMNQICRTFKMLTSGTGNISQIGKSEEFDEATFFQTLSKKKKTSDKSALETSPGKKQSLEQADNKNKGPRILDDNNPLLYANGPVELNVFVELKNPKDAKMAANVLKGKRFGERDLLFETKISPYRKKGGSRESVSSNKIVIKNLPFFATKKEVKELIKKFAELSYLRMPRDLESRDKIKGYAFAEFESEESAKKAAESLNGLHFYGRRLVVEGAKQ